MLNNPDSDLESRHLLDLLQVRRKQQNNVERKQSKKMLKLQQYKLSEVINISAYLGNLQTCLKKIVAMGYSSCTDP